eukprot:TRINITY_DN54421_c0_g1_i1.p1 TRINITY_DN54421_c0_g1~~TRINITY_DN54421_c0_g1_i1.p1  ORF type:complete len:274 (+),score=19.21 TRINITY_DN54421_c0_g1_i1:37-858(+)
MSSPNPTRRHFTESKLASVPDEPKTGIRTAKPATPATPSSTERVRLKRTVSPHPTKPPTPGGRKHALPPQTAITMGTCLVEPSPARRLLRQVPSPPHKEASPHRHRAAAPAPISKEERPAAKALGPYSHRNWECTQSTDFRPGRHVFNDVRPTNESDGLVIASATGATSLNCFHDSHKRHFNNPVDTEYVAASEALRSGRRQVPQSTTPSRTDSRGRRHYTEHNTETPAAADRVLSPQRNVVATPLFSFAGDLDRRPQGRRAHTPVSVSTRPW